MITKSSYKSLTSAAVVSLLTANTLILSACGAQVGESIDTTAETVETTVPGETVEPGYELGLEVRRFDNRAFRIATFELQNFHYNMVMDEETGNIFDDSLYQRNRNVEEKYGVKLEQSIYTGNGNTIVSKTVAAGDDEFDSIVVRCTEALTQWNEGYILCTEELPNIDLTKKYWDQSINDSLSINGKKHIAEGAFNLDIYDLTFCLIFNKQMITDYKLDDPYELVSSGAWTLDNMEKLMKAVTADLNGDTTMDENDRYGYTAHPKMVAPGFWIGSGVTSISKDKEDVPYISMTEDRFVDVFGRIFELAWDSGYFYMTQGDQLDVPTECRKLFESNGSLFCDMSFNFMESMRATNVDFGIIPYPKYDESQDSYHSRVCYYMPTVVPVTCTDTDFVGYMLQVLNFESYNTVIPAYYDITLKGKVLRDDQSSDMLDIIFDSRVIDIGDSTLCEHIRDGFVYQMMRNGDRDLISAVDSRRDAIIDKLPKSDP